MKTVKLNKAQLRKLINESMDPSPDLSQLTQADVRDIRNLIHIARDLLDYERPEFDGVADNTGLTADEVGRLYDRCWDLMRLLGD